MRRHKQPAATPKWAGLLAVALLWTGGLAPPLARAEWTQYRGSAGNGVYLGRIRTNWTAQPPRLLWRQPLTNGLSSVTVSGSRVFTQVRQGDTEYCLALSTLTGALLWTHPVGLARYPDGGVGSDDGPRSTPVVKDGRVYVLGSYLNLHCLDAVTGASIWSRDLRAEFGGTVIPWQNAASPLIEGDLLLLNLNAAPARLAAFRLDDGALVWRRHNEALTHSTPVAATIGGVRQVIFLTQSGLVALTPADGLQLWRFAALPYSTSIAITPVVESNRVYYAGAYAMGSAAAEIVELAGALSARQLLGRRSSRMIHWSTPVAVNGYIYGLFGQTSGRLRCLDLRNNGEYTWEGPDFGTGATLLVDGKIFVASEYGDLVLVEPDPAAYREITRFRATQGRIWNSPALSDGVLYVRATTELAAFDVAPPPPPPVRLTASPDLVEGRIRFEVANVNGAPIEAERVPRLLLKQSDDLARPLAEWAPVALAWTLTDGVCRATLEIPPGAAARFFLLTEQP